MPTDLPSLFSNIVRLEIELWNAVERRLRDEHGVALSWYEVMDLIDRSDSATVKHLTQELSITVGGASKIADRIQSAGYLRRTPHPTDGRSSILELTRDGTRLIGKLRTTVTQELGHLISHSVPDAVTQRLANDIGTLRKALTHNRDGKEADSP